MWLLCNISHTKILRFSLHQINRFSFFEKQANAEKFEFQVVATIECNQVTVIQGSTGSGKTTQVPQYILDHYADMGKYCNIIVTQPRRIAAMSIAKRVCSERKWDLGTICGYQVSQYIDLISV